MNQIKIVLFIFLVVIAVSCKTSQRSTTPRNLERIYDPASSSIHPEINVYNTSDSSSLIVEKIYTRELLYNNANSENKLMARVKVFYNLYDIENKHELVDSSTIIYKFEKSPKYLYHLLEIPFKSQEDRSYILEIITSDLNRKSNQYTFKRVNRTKVLSSSDFAIFDTSSNENLSNLFIKRNKAFGIKSYKTKFDSLHVHFFKNDFKIAQPPFINDTLNKDEFVPDTTWICYLESINYQNYTGEGIYYFTEVKEFDQQEGLSLFNFGNGFPVVTSPSDLAGPIIYLDSINLDFGMDSIGKLTKLAVDEFWLAKANNMDKSRELLKIYYNRVLFANMYFTSYKEGWQTDRGMIYIIYGLPDYLFKSGDEERWIYNPDGVGTGIVFIFKHVYSPFSTNHFELDREKLKVTGWDDAIELWEKGEVLYFQN